MDNNTSKVARISRTVAVVSTVIGVMTFGLGASAFATPPPDPGGTGAAMGDVQTGIESWVQTYGIPAIVAILLLGIGLALLIKFARKAKSAV